MNSYPAPRYTPSIDGLTLAAILFMALIGLVLVDDLFGPQPGSAKAKEVTLGQPAVELVVAEPSVVAETRVVDEEVGSGEANPSKSAGDARLCCAL